MHHGDSYADTFSFVTFGVTHFGRYSTPPPEAPKPLKELYAILAACLQQLTANESA